eukprot:COSAG04_NODE_5728_length_1509_cov_1.326241_2_plen_216_part_00
MPQVATWAQLIHFVPFAVLTVSPALQALGVMPIEKTNDLLLAADLTGLGPLPKFGDVSDWSGFIANLMIAVGVMYLRAAVTGDYHLTKALCFPRMCIGLLNAKAVFDGTMALPFAALAAAEVGTAAAVFLTLPDDDTKTDEPKLATWAQLIHFIPCAVLTVSPALQALGVMPIEKTNDLLLAADLTGLGPLPAFPELTDWSGFGQNLMIVVGLCW